MQGVTTRYAESLTAPSVEARPVLVGCQQLLFNSKGRQGSTRGGAEMTNSEYLQEAARESDAERKGSHDRAYRIYCVRANGAVVGVVPEARLYDLLVSIKGLSFYRTSRSLENGQIFETDILVHGEPLHLYIQVNVWMILSGGCDPAIKQSA